MNGITYIMFGIITILLTHYKPSAYWNNNSRRFLRSYIGDEATALLHELVGVGLIAMGIAILLKLEN
jgi:hypothetical protein